MALKVKTGKWRMGSGFAKGEEVTSECEVTAEGDDDLHRFYSDCPKNPGHKSFIPVPDFQMSDLPLEHRTPTVMEMIKTLCDLTVKIKIKYISKDRPEKYADSDSEYPHYKQRGSKRVPRYGTGFVRNLVTDEKKSCIEGKPCPCHECKTSLTPAMKYWTLLVFTATHVIFDDSEAECSTFECFFDTEDRKGVKTMYGHSLKTRRLDFDKYQSDSCVVNCVTHDKDLFIKLNDLCEKYNFTFDMDRYSTPFAFMISHPHGCSKRISIGTISHFTIPIDEEYPINCPIMFEKNTLCRLPLLPWSCRRKERLHSDAHDQESGERTLSSYGKQYEKSKNEKKGQTENEYVEKFGASAQPQKTLPSKDKSEHSQELDSSILKNETNKDDGLVENKSQNVQALNPNLLQSNEELVSLLTSAPQKSNFESIPDSDTDDANATTATDFEEMLHGVTLSNIDPQYCVLSPGDYDTPDARQESVPTGINFDLDFSALFGDKLSIPEDALILLPPELEHALLKGPVFSQNDEFSLEPGTEFQLPLGTAFHLPEDASYALRFASLSPAWFTVPTGTRFTKPDGTEIYLPPEAEFRAPMLNIRFAYVTYDMASCPGSSGAAIHQRGNSMQAPLMILNISHFGTFKKDGKNRSGLDSFYLGVN